MPARMPGRLPARRRAATVSVAVLALVASLGATATADDDVPTREQVDDARSAAVGKARDVATVQAELAVANSRLQQSAIEAAQAAEAWNGARYRLEQAREQASRAESDARAAERSVRGQQQAYGDTVVTGYQRAPELSALQGVLRANGIQEALETTTTLDQTRTAMDEQYDAFRASATVASVASRQAEDARTEAADAAADAEQARAAAESAQTAAAAEATRIAEEKTRLIGELADLQNISVDLAQRRQSALEARAAEEAAAAREAEVVQVAEPDAEAPSRETDRGDQQAAAGPAPEPAPAPAPAPDPAPAPAPDPQPAPGPAPAPAPAPAPPPSSGGAQAAIAFARAQIGDPYVWGGAGPDSWDCSGLTMGAWARGGKSLPHYSVAQYEQSTPISIDELRPGDLIFWGSSSDPSSIYHEAIYTGNGMMVHAPRTGRNVTEESMYYWITPNFFARP